MVSTDRSELHHEGLTAAEMSQINAYRKARQVAKQHPDALVIGADTLVSLGTKLYGKPSDRKQAERMLSELSGRTHSVVTGVCLLHLRGHRQKVFSETSFVTFHSLSAERIAAYLDRVNPLDKAGAYAVQECAELIVENIVGSFTNVVGLPLARLREELLMWT